MSKPYLDGKLLFIAGGTGSAGSALIQRITANFPNTNIRAVYFKTEPFLKHSRVQYVKADLRIMDECFKAVSGCDCAVMAASDTAGSNMAAARPWALVSDNAIMNTRMFEAFSKAKIRRAVYIGTATVYQEFDGFIKENQLDLNQNPHEAYMGAGWTSRYLEKLGSFWRQKTGMEVISVRLANIFGPFASFNPERSFFIPALIRKAVDKLNPFEVWGSPDVTRDVLFSEDFADAVSGLLNKEELKHGVFNIGSGAATTVADAVNWALECAGYKPSKINYDITKPSFIKFRALDISKIESVTGWKPKHTVKAGLKKTMEWWVNNKDTWEKIKKKVLICGATGFIGRNIAENTAALRQYDVIGTYFRSKPYNYPGIKLIKADLTDIGDVENALEGIDILIQTAAATSGVKDIVSKPHYHVTDNVVMNALIFKKALENKVSHVIFPSCTTMYASSGKPVKETDFDANADILPAYFPSAWTKVYNEKMCEFYSKLGCTRYTVIRHSNIYGPYDKYDLERSHVFGATITKVMAAPDNGCVTIWGDGSEQRDLLHVSDLVELVNSVLAGQKNIFELINAGLGASISVDSLVKKIIEISGRKITIKYDSSKPNIKTKISLDSSKAKHLFGWEPRIGLNQGIKMTLDWYSNNTPSK